MANVTKSSANDASAATLRPGQFGLGRLLWIVTLAGTTLGLPITWNPRLPVEVIYAMYGISVMAIGIFLLGSAKSARRWFVLGGGAAAVAVLYIVWVSGPIVNSYTKGITALERYQVTALGSWWTTILYVAYFGLLIAAVRAFLKGDRFVGAASLILLCYWGYWWQRMVESSPNFPWRG